MHLSHSLLLINLASTWFMTGLIWFVQVVHYPQFSGVGEGSFVLYHHRHTRLTTWVVGPPMLIEAFSAVGLACYGGALASSLIAWVGLSLLAIIWISTASLQVPKHNTLSHGWNERAGNFLCATNWIRTIAWSARAALMTWATWHALASSP